MFITSDEIGLEDVEKKRSIVVFSSEHEGIKLEMEEMKPVMKQNKEVIIVRDGKPRKRTSQLF